MKKIVLLITLILFFIFLSCKKKEAEPASSNNKTTGNPIIIGGDYGTFLSVYSVTQFGAILYTDSIINASFYDSPTTGFNYISAGTVSVNNTTLFTSQSPIVYNKTNGINMKDLLWQISGNGTITATNFSYTPVYPTYTGYNQLPDTVTKLSGFNLIVNGITNFNKPIYITLAQNNAVITKTIATTPATIAISSNDLANFTTGSDFNLRFSISNYSNTILNSKQYGLNANRTYQKAVYLK